jgi:uncharacterized repeat protein (TIGR01451 family)
MLLLLLLPATAQAQGGGEPFPEKVGGKLSSRLAQLTQPAGGGISIQSLPAGSLLQNEQGDLLVYMRLSDTSERSLQALTDAGATIVHLAEAYQTVTAYVPAARLPALADLEVVENIREELRPHSSRSPKQAEDAWPTLQADCVGATTSEGDALLKADRARQRFSLSGNGVTVGVLSDSYAQVSSPTTSLGDIASGDLPGGGNPCGRDTAVTVVAEGAPGDIDEGRAMLQIIHDLAPGAALAFASANGGVFAFADNVRALSEQAGADIIVDDIGYSSQPFFQDGPVSVAVQDVTAQGVIYVSAAGNSQFRDGAGSYMAPAYRPTTCPVVTYQGSTYSIGNDCHDFNPDAATDPQMSFTLEAGGLLAFNFQWAEAWYGVETDLDIYLVDGANNVLAASFDINPGTQGTQIPFELFGYENQTGATQTVNLIIPRFGTQTPPLKFILDSADGLIEMEYSAANSTDTFGPTIFGHAAAKEAIAVAAVPYDDTQTPEAFNSRGNVIHYFGPVRGTTPAAALATPEVRAKPDLAAIDGVRTTFFGDWLDGGWRFYGTSAAAPHVAAVAALMAQWSNRFDLSFDAATTLKQNAAAIAGGAPQTTGAGLVDALAALTAMSPIKTNLTSNPTPIESTTTTITYLLTLENISPHPATDVSVIVTIPDQTVYVPNSANAGGTETSDGSGMLVWSSLTIPGQTTPTALAAATENVVTLFFQVNVATEIPDGTQLTSHIAVTSGEGAVISQNKVHTVGVGHRIYLPLLLRSNQGS